MTAFFKKKKFKENLDVEKVLKAQSERIEELKAEIYNLETELLRLRKREESVTDALSFASLKAKEYLDESKVRYSLELLRLDSFREKWKGYLSDIKSAENLGEKIINTEKLLKKCADEIKKSVCEDLPMLTPQEVDYKNETKRILETEAFSCDTDFMEDDELKKLIVQLLEKKES